MGIALRANAEINAQFAEERRPNARYHAHADAERDRELATMQAQNKEELSTAESRLKRAEEDRGRTEFQYRVLLSSIDRLPKSATECPGCRVCALDEVTDL
jgi:hypothetical protein